MKKINLFLSLLVLALSTQFNVYAQSTEKTGYKPGDVAIDFKLKNIDGKTVSLSDYSQVKGFIVVFTCNSCPYAIAYEDRIVALDKKYTPKGFHVIAINPNDPAAQPKDSYEAMQVRAKEKAFTFPYLFDDGQKIYPQYGATKTPHVFVLNKEKGKNVVRYIGAIDNNYADANDVTEKFVENAVDALLAQKAVKQPITAAIGCSIKTKK
ncbi:MAG: thioredoxin family protein [Paludibacter sp.]|nr:thioredoxin family protein [Paludibacter sp.]